LKPPYKNPQRNLPTFQRLFEEAGVDSATIGGIAAIIRRAEPRETTDADFVVSNISDLEERLRTINPRYTHVSREPDGTPYLIQGETADGMHFDIFIAETPFEQEVLATKDSNATASAEAIIVYKLVADRPQDIDDINSILRKHSNLDGLDVAKIERWAEYLGVIDKWHEFADRRLTQTPVPEPEIDEQPELGL
jgi:hypothetical protein